LSSGSRSWPCVGSESRISSRASRSSKMAAVAAARSPYLEEGKGGGEGVGGGEFSSPAKWPRCLRGAGEGEVKEGEVLMGALLRRAACGRAFESFVRALPPREAWAGKGGAHASPTAAFLEQTTPALARLQSQLRFPNRLALAGGR
jgi:hypothetical protein